MSTDWDGEGYEAEASTGGIFLRLKSKGEKVRLRLCSTACRYTDTFEDQRTGEKTIRKKASWLAILKEIVSGQPSKRVVVFTGGPMIYGALKELSESEDWGDPTQYDITVERTEEQGRYYVVTPLPKPPIGPMHADERALLEEAAIDWPAICVKGKPGYAAQSAEHDPFADDE